LNKFINFILLEVRCVQGIQKYLLCVVTTLSRIFTFPIIGKPIFSIDTYRTCLGQRYQGRVSQIRERRIAQIIRQDRYSHSEKRDF
jgi:hypothetical protein